MVQEAQEAQACGEAREETGGEQGDLGAEVLPLTALELCECIVRHRVGFAVRDVF